MKLSAEDRLDIIELQGHYAAGIDLRDYELFRLAFAPDVFFEFPVIDSGVGLADYNETPGLRGIEPVMQWGFDSHKMLDGSQHFMGNSVISQRDGGVFHRSYVIATLTLTGCEGGDMFRIAAIYNDRVEKRPEGWRIVHRLPSMLWQEGNLKIAELMFAGN